MTDNATQWATLPAGNAKPVYTSEDVTVYQAEALDVLRQLPADSVDAVITDPPYSSGGLFRSDRSTDPVYKYQHDDVALVRPSFSGDNRDGRAWAYWSALWLSECLRITKQAGYCLTFADWRQVPHATDAMQAGGWVWRGLSAWDKTEGARAPHTGYFRHQAEYVVWGTKGTSLAADWGGPWPGVYRFPVKKSDKHHLTGKPTPLLRALAQCCRPGGLILDPFAGSGTTGVAARLEGRKALLIEQEPAHVHTTLQRLHKTQPPFFAAEG